MPTASERSSSRTAQPTTDSQPASNRAGRASRESSRSPVPDIATSDSIRPLPAQYTALDDAVPAPIADAVTVSLSRFHGRDIAGTRFHLDTAVEAISNALSIAHRKEGSGASPSPLPVEHALSIITHRLGQLHPAYLQYTDPQIYDFPLGAFQTFTLGGGFFRKVEYTWDDHQRLISGVLALTLDSIATAPATTVSVPDSESVPASDTAEQATEQATEQTPEQAGPADSRPVDDILADSDLDPLDITDFDRADRTRSRI